MEENRTREDDRLDMLGTGISEDIVESCCDWADRFAAETGYDMHFDNGPGCGYWIYSYSNYYTREWLLYPDGSYTIYYMDAIPEADQERIRDLLRTWCADISEDGQYHTW